MVVLAVCLQVTPVTKNESIPSQPQGTNELVTSIPVKIPSYGLIFLKAQINNSPPLSFALDSGASFPFVINTSRAKALGLNLEDESVRSGGAGEGSYKIKFAKDITVGLPGLTLRQQTAVAINLDTIETLAGRQLDGLVGNPIFRRFVVEIDYVDHTVKLYEPQNYNYGGSGEILPLLSQGDYLLVKATLGVTPARKIAGTFLIDTGGGMVTTVLATPFVESKNVVGSLSKTIRDDSLSGLGGDIKLLVSRAHSLAIGKLVVQEPIIHLSQNRSGALASPGFDGVIGAELLNRFRVIFDFSRRQLILEPNRHFGKSSDYNQTGISVRSDRERFKIFTVYDVLENSPGSEAGVKKGDVLVQINERSAKEFTLADIYQLFKESWVLRLTLSRGDKTFVATIKPRRMV